MENKTDRDDFESFLKENADGFLMVPSRKVWYGIYNNMHPDRKWPSMAVCLLILSAVMYIGVSNNNSLSMAARRANAQNVSVAKNNTPENNNNTSTNISGLSVHPLTTSVTSANDDAADYTADNDDHIAGQISTGNIGTGITGIDGTNNNIAFNSGTTNSVSSAPANNIYSNTDNFGADIKSPVVYTDKYVTDKNTVSHSDIAGNNVKPVMDEDIAATAAKKDKQDKANKEAALKLAAVNNKSWVEDYAFRNKPPMNKFHDRATIGYYITPSFGYRTLTAKAGYADINIKDQLKDTRALGMEAGASVQYRVGDHFRLKGGLQINYTNYISSVTDIGHTLATSLSVSRGSDINRASKYSVAPGESTLNRSTVQLSVPVGADLKIAGRNKIKWYVGGTVQPTYLVSGSSYVLSQDNNFYISDKSELRRANVNVAAETFVSYRPSPGITLSVGPQVRYQLMSTYKSEYNYSEKLYNVGIKIGLTTGF